MFSVNPGHVDSENTLSGEGGIKEKYIYIMLVSSEENSKAKSKSNSLASQQPPCAGTFYFDLPKRITFTAWEQRHWSPDKRRASTCDCPGCALTLGSTSHRVVDRTLPQSCAGGHVWSHRCLWYLLPPRRIAICLC